MPISKPYILLNNKQRRDSLSLSLSSLFFVLHTENYYASFLLVLDNIPCYTILFEIYMEMNYLEVSIGTHIST